MFKTLRPIILLLCVYAGAVNASEIQHHQFASKLLGRDYAFTVYIPDGYQASDQHFPVLYLLHGSVGNENNWVDQGHIQPTADELIKNKLLPPLLIVMPGHSQSS